MTERLYYTDSYLRDFTAQVVDASSDGRALYLDRTAFYPTSGGQPHDLGQIGGVAVVEVIDEGERVAHRVAAPVGPGPLACAIDWDRRWDHMQQHTGQHLLSAVLHERLGLTTVSFHLGSESSTIDIEGPGQALDAQKLAETEAYANRLVCQNRPLQVVCEDAAAAAGLRKASSREGTLRVVVIDGLDRSACGGTHVRHTGEIGPILIRKLEKIRNSTRVEFLCGARAVRRARADYDALSRAAQSFSSPLDEVPALVAAHLEAERTESKARRKLELEVAGYQGRELWEQTAPGADGLRRVTRQATTGSLEDLRALAQAYTERPKALFLATLDDPPTVLMAVSTDSGLDAGKKLREVLQAAGGRGGGNARMAQGSVPPAALAGVAEQLG